MNSELILIGLFGLITIAIEGLLWGMMGYVLFKYLRIADKFWIGGAVVFGFVYFLWEEIIMGQMIGKLGLQVNNQAVIDYVGDDLFTIDLSDLIFSLAAVIIGFRISQGIVKKMIKKNTKEVHD